MEESKEPPTKKQKLGEEPTSLDYCMSRLTMKRLTMNRLTMNPVGSHNAIPLWNLSMFTLPEPTKTMLPIFKILDAYTRQSIIDLYMISPFVTDFLKNSDTDVQNPIRFLAYDNVTRQQFGLILDSMLLDIDLPSSFLNHFQLIEVLFYFNLIPPIRHILDSVKANQYLDSVQDFLSNEVGARVLSHYLLLNNHHFVDKLLSIFRLDEYLHVFDESWYSGKVSIEMIQKLCSYGYTGLSLLVDRPMRLLFDSDILFSFFNNIVKNQGVEFFKNFLNQTTPYLDIVIDATSGADHIVEWLESGVRFEHRITLEYNEIDEEIMNRLLVYVHTLNVTSYNLLTSRFPNVTRLVITEMQQDKVFNDIGILFPNLEELTILGNGFLRFELLPLRLRYLKLHNVICIWTDMIKMLANNKELTVIILDSSAEAAHNTVAESVFQQLLTTVPSLKELVVSSKFTSSLDNLKKKFPEVTITLHIC